jgi:tRNA(Met) C34 N-acetyltransferase TmcA
MARAMLPNQRVWITSPTYELSKKVFREVFLGFHQYLPLWVLKSSESELFIKLVNGSSIQGKSADNPISLIGEGVDFLIIDEACMCIA